MKRRFAIAALLGAAAVATVVVACSDQHVYVYSAQKWNPADDCVEPYAPLEVVDGDGADATCALRCMTDGVDVFVSSMCPPLPPNATEITQGPDFESACKPAFDAARAKRVCGALDASIDASTDADAATDAAEEAAPDDSGSDAPAEASEDAPADAAQDG